MLRFKRALLASQIERERAQAQSGGWSGWKITMGSVNFKQENPQTEISGEASSTQNRGVIPKTYKPTYQDMQLPCHTSLTWKHETTSTMGQRRVQRYPSKSKYLVTIIIIIKNILKPLQDFVVLKHPTLLPMQYHAGLQRVKPFRISPLIPCHLPPHQFLQHWVSWCSRSVVPWYTLEIRWLFQGWCTPGQLNQSWARESHNWNGQPWDCGGNLRVLLVHASSQGPRCIDHFLLWPTSVRLPESSMHFDHSKNKILRCSKDVWEFPELFLTSKLPNIMRCCWNQLSYEKKTALLSIVLVV